MLLAATAGARVISTDLCAHVKSHNVVTLPRGNPRKQVARERTERASYSLHFSKKEDFTVFERFGGLRRIGNYGGMVRECGPDPGVRSGMRTPAVADLGVKDG